MNFIRQIERMSLLNKLIIQQRTGTPDELAGRLNISRRQVFNCIDNLKDLGAPIQYCKRTKTYYYEDNARVNIQFSLSVLSDGEQKEIFGGRALFQAKCNFISLFAYTLSKSYDRYM